MQLNVMQCAEHHPSHPSSVQYRSALFTHSPAQAEAAAKSKAALSYKAVTAIEPFKFWTDAEGVYCSCV
jgi:peptide methionine sulfoxide reductase MsrA